MQVGIMTVLATLMLFLGNSIVWTMEKGSSDFSFRVDKNVQASVYEVFYAKRKEKIEKNEWESKGQESDEEWDKQEQVHYYKQQRSKVNLVATSMCKKGKRPLTHL